MLYGFCVRVVHVVVCVVVLGVCVCYGVRSWRCVLLFCVVVVCVVIDVFVCV